MDINEAIQHCLDVAEQQNQMANGKWIGEEGEKQRQECAECAADHKQLAVWLMELKDLRGAQNDQCVFIQDLMDELKEAKSLLKLAVDDFDIAMSNGGDTCEVCEFGFGHCKGNPCKWRFANEAKKLLGEEF